MAAASATASSIQFIRKEAAANPNSTTKYKPMVGSFSHPSFLFFFTGSHHPFLPRNAEIIQFIISEYSQKRK